MNTKVPFALKRKNSDEGWRRDQCAAARCSESPIVDDDTRRVWPERVPLCEWHWKLRAEMEVES